MICAAAVPADADLLVGIEPSTYAGTNKAIW